MPRYDDEYNDDRPRRPRRDEREAPRRGNERPAPQDRSDERARRETLIERRMRAARGEDYEYDDYEPYDDRPAYRRPGDNYMPRYAGPTGCAGQALYTVLGIVAVALVAVIALPRLLNGFIPQVNVPDQIRQVVATPTPTLIDRGGTILQIRNLNRLETQQYSSERVIEAKVERGNPLDLLLGDRLLLIARGTVIAGVDMSKIRDQDVVISPDGESITLTLPPTEIFLRTLDNEQTRVYDRQTGIFANQDENLETQARQEAEQQILAGACEDGVMQKAADAAQRSLEQFLKLAGFQTVTVNAPAGECVAGPIVPTQSTSAAAP